MPTTKGNYELRSSEAGGLRCWVRRPSYLPAIGQDFYGGPTDVLQQDVVLASEHRAAGHYRDCDGDSDAAAAVDCAGDA